MPPCLASRVRFVSFCLPAAVGCCCGIVSQPCVAFSAQQPYVDLELRAVLFIFSILYIRTEKQLCRKTYSERLWNTIRSQRVGWSVIQISVYNMFYVNDRMLYMHSTHPDDPHFHAIICLNDNVCHKNGEGETHLCISFSNCYTKKLFGEKPLPVQNELFCFDVLLRRAFQNQTNSCIS